MSKKNRVVNITPFDAKVRIHGNGDFILTFIDKIGDDHSRLKIVNIRLERWWLKVIAKLLWNVVRTEKREINALESAMGGES